MTDTSPNLLAHPPEKTAGTLRITYWLTLVLLVLLLGGGALRLLANTRDATALEQRTELNLTRTVNVTHAKKGKLTNSIVLPGSLTGYTEAVIYARSNGYLRAWYKNIGDQVKKGELLAVIDAPEQTQELAQAKAMREQVNARLALAKLTQERWENLRLHDSVPQQELEEKRSAYQQAQADLAVIDANISRLQQLESFRQITAPFAGVITRRSVDVGELVAPGSKELFALTQQDKLRLAIWVPQVYAAGIKPEQEVSVSVRESAASYHGKVTHISGSIDPVTRSRQVEVVLDNHDGKLVSGAYAEAKLELARGLPAMIVPPSVLVIGKDAPYVVLVDGDGKVAFRTVKLGRDLGKTLEIVSGVSPLDTLVVSPSELLEPGDQVITRLLEQSDGDKPKGSGGPGAGSGKPEHTPEHKAAS